MYRLTIFILVSCVTSHQLVGAVRNGGSPSRRSNLYFDSYNHPALEEFEESEDGLGRAVLMHPEEVLDVPPVSMERDYEMERADAEQQLLEDSPRGSEEDSQKTRGFIQDWLEQIQNAFSKWPPELPSNTSPPREFYYQIDSSLLETHRTSLELLLDTVARKTCLTIVENAESPQITFIGVPGCSIKVYENVIAIGHECFEPTMITKLILKMFGFCSRTSRANELNVDSYRREMQQETEEDTDCRDTFGLCIFMARENSSLPCSHASHIQKAMCPRTCRLCGDSCVDYDPDCNTGDTLRDCLLNWNQKKLGCAATCGLCNNRKRSLLCYDLFGCCEYYAKRGYCHKLPKVMKHFCRLSCGYCKVKSCVDLRSDCSELQKLGGCQKMADLMEKNCPKTCNVCKNEAELRNSQDWGPTENCEQDVDFVNKYCFWNSSIDD